MNADANVEKCSTTAALHSLGALSEAESKQFEQRIASGCPFCVAEFEAYSNVADHLTLGISQVEPSRYLRQRLLDHASAATNPPLSSEKDSAKDKKVVRQLDAHWIPLPTPGIAVRFLLGQKTVLVRMRPGSVFPEHEHHQLEQCYVLEGSVTDSDGLTLSAGDFICMPSGITHR